LADSLETFAELNDVMQSWSDLEDAEGFAIDDYDAKSPAVQAVRARAKALVGRVHACGDYGDTLDALVGKKVRLRASNPIVKLSARRQWLASWFLIEEGSREEAERKLRAETRADEKGLPSTQICRLLGQFLLGDEALESSLAQATRHRAGLVRAVADLVTKARQPARAKSRVRWFAGLPKTAVP
jgi:hypothetical protein